jgi:ribonuclease HI
MELNNGIGQGDPLSMALYQFYNADLVEIPKDKEETAIAYVDDVLLTATADTFQEAHAKLEDMMTREGGAIEWTVKHNSKFEYSKIALIDFAHQNKKVTRPPLTLPSGVISPTKSTKYLGVILDQNLGWKEQIAYAIGKGSKWAAQVRRVVRPSWGLTPRSARKLYMGVALPRIFYGVEIWCDPPRTQGQPNRDPATTGAIKKLATIQRQGALAITGGLRTSPTDSLNAHAAITPMRLKVRKVRHNAAIRIATLPQKHPLYKPIRRAARRQVGKHKAPLHHIASCLNTDPSEIETIPVIRTNPAKRQENPIDIVIPKDKKDSKRVDAQAKEVIKVYTDGSLHNGGVGAAAILYRAGKRPRILKLYLGTAEQHTVYEAELVGLLLGIHLIKTERNSSKECAIGADNQAALKALSSELTKPGQHLAAEFLKISAQLKKTRKSKRFSITARWTAGHVGIKGNEKADKEAKLAAEGASSDKTDLPSYVRKTIKKSASAIKQVFNDMINKEWKAEWQESGRYKRFKAPDIYSPHSKKYLELTSDYRISRRMASLIYQLRSGHVPLNAYLFRFKRAESGRCPACGEEWETVEHFLLRCPAYAHERWSLQRLYQEETPRTTSILAEPKKILPLVSYIQATGRFEEHGGQGE